MDMINEPMDITRLFPVRRKNEQKAAFRDAVQDYFSNLGYSVAVEENKKGCYNIVIGDAASAQYLITAHYDTPATSLFPNFYTPNNLVLYFAYQMLLVFAYMAIAFVVCVIAGLIYFDKTVIFYRNCRNWKEFMIKSEREAKDERNRGGVNIESFRKTVCGFF
jgi:hypothetical protein